MLDRFTINQRLWSFFGVILLLLLAVALISWRASTEIQTQMSFVVESMQPAMQAAQGVEIQLHKTSSALNYFLKSGISSHKEVYAQSLQQLQTAITDLATMPVVMDDEEIKNQVATINTHIQKLASYKDRLILYGTSNVVNMAALELMESKLNPQILPLNQALADMVSELPAAGASAETLELYSKMQTLRYYVAQAASSLRAYIGLKSDTFLDNTSMYVKQIQELLEEMQEWTDQMSFTQQTAFEQILKISSSYFQDMFEVLQVQRSEQAYKDVYLLKTEVGPLTFETEKQINQLTATMHQHVGEANSKMVEKVVSTAWTVIVILGTGIGFFALFGWLLNSSIATKLSRAVHAMEEIASGEADLRIKLDSAGRDELSQLGGAFNRFLEKIAATIAEVAHGMAQLDTATSGLARVTSQIQSGIARQQEGSQQMVQAMEQMLHSSNEVSSRVALATTETERANTASVNGSRQVDQTTRAINSLVDEVGRATQVINELERFSNQIGSVVTTIEGIAGQTNLLALNAAIEAARAGEQGRGFAVVADEVRTLASRTQDSTTEIQSMISKLQEASKQAVAVMSQSGDQAKSTVQQAESTRQSLTEIATAVGQIRLMNQQISGATRDQNQIVGGVNTIVTQLSSVAAESGRNKAELETAAQELGQLSSHLKRLIGGFNI